MEKTRKVFKFLCSTNILHKLNPLFPTMIFLQRSNMKVGYVKSRFTSSPLNQFEIPRNNCNTTFLICCTIVRQWLQIMISVSNNRTTKGS